MLEQFLRARLPEQIVALIENLEQNPDASHLEKVLEFESRYRPDITKFERWMLSRAVSKVHKLVKRDELLRGAMEIVINKPEEKKTVRYDPNTFMISTGTTNHSLLAQQAQNTWTDPRQAFLAGQQRGLF
jgi:uncharacterized protein involved in exopolysaccharide biosynthesis